MVALLLLTTFTRVASLSIVKVTALYPQSGDLEHFYPHRLPISGS
jgi:hypothetical protein